MAVAASIHAFLLSAIGASDMPPAAKALIIAAVQPPCPLSDDAAYIHINPVMRPSMFSKGDGGKLSGNRVFHSKHGGADLVMVYNQRKAPKQTYFPAGISTKDQRVQWAKMNGMQIMAFSNNYLERAVSYGNGIDPRVSVWLQA